MKGTAKRVHLLTSVFGRSKEALATHVEESLLAIGDRAYPVCRMARTLPWSPETGLHIYYPTKLSGRPVKGVFHKGLAVSV